MHKEIEREERVKERLRKDGEKEGNTDRRRQQGRAGRDLVCEALRKMNSP